MKHRRGLARPERGNVNHRAVDEVLRRHSLCPQFGEVLADKSQLVG
jgi:hypothetical protein